MDSFPSTGTNLRSTLCKHLISLSMYSNNEGVSSLSQSSTLCSFPSRPGLYNEERVTPDYTDSPCVDGYPSPLYSDRPLYSDSPVLFSSLPAFGNHPAGIRPEPSGMYMDPSSTSLFHNSSSPLFTDHSPTPSWTAIHPPVWSPREPFLPSPRPVFGSPFPPKRPESSPFSLKHTLSADSSEFVPKKADYSIDIEKVRRGEDKRTTLMVRNIPNG